MREDNSINKENAELQENFEKINKRKMEIQNKSKVMDGDYKIVRSQMESICNNRATLRAESSKIDDEHSKLKESFENHPNKNSKECLQMKKAFITLQEAKVKLMQDDLEFEKLQESLNIQIRTFQDEYENIELEDNQQIKLWNECMEKFEGLKGRKELVLKKDSDLEKQSKGLKKKFEENKQRKDKVIKEFKTIEKSQLLVMEKYENFQQKKSAVENRFNMIASQSENLQENFSQLKENKQNMETKFANIEERSGLNV